MLVHLFAVICLPFVYHRCWYIIQFLSLCKSFFNATEFLNESKKRAEEAGLMLHCKDLHSSQTIVSTFLTPTHVLFHWSG